VRSILPPTTVNAITKTTRPSSVMMTRAAVKNVDDAALTVDVPVGYGRAASDAAAGTARELTGRWPWHVRRPTLASQRP